MKRFTDDFRPKIGIFMGTKARIDYVLYILVLAPVGFHQIFLIHYYYQLGFAYVGLLCLYKS